MVFFFESEKFIGMSLRFFNDAECADHSFVIEQFAKENKIAVEIKDGKPTFYAVRPNGTMYSKYKGNEVRIEIFAPNAPKYEGQDQ